MRDYTITPKVLARIKELEKLERNIQITIDLHRYKKEASGQGRKYVRFNVGQHLANKYGITRVRVYQIYRKYRNYTVEQLEEMMQQADALREVREKVRR